MWRSWQKSKISKWLYPGLGVKRWVILFMAGITFMGLGFAYLLKDIYESWTFPPIFYYLTLQFIDRVWRAVLFFGLGVLAIGFSLMQLARSIFSALLPSGTNDVAEALYQRRRRSRGPKVVAIGGGHGLSTLLRGLKEFTDNIVAIVTVADDGGSSGRLRRDLGVPPPGDFRNCIAALADDEALLTKLFQYRFGKGAGLDGHSLGNLLITALVEITGSFERALLESSRVLAVQGRIFPSTLDNVVLCAEVHEPETGNIGQVEGECRIPKAGGTIERVFLKPSRVRAYPGTVRAILEADIIIIGPGSLFTSIMPNLLVEDIVKAIRVSKALKIYVCNIATQRGETDGFTLQDHIEALERHTGKGLFDIVLANDNLDCEIPSAEPVRPVCKNSEYKIITADLVDRESPWRHDPHKLAKTIMNIYQTYRKSS
ncbi:MAG TPA: YvcK family protein [Chloroflexi bacterium]|nr:YvcK family protein [Chloroflexota bacterium]